MKLPDDLCSLPDHPAGEDAAGLGDRLVPDTGVAVAVRVPVLGSA